MKTAVRSWSLFVAAVLCLPGPAWSEDPAADKEPGATEGAADSKAPAAEPAGEKAAEPGKDSEPAKPAAKPVKLSPEELAERQEQIAGKFKHFEDVLLRMAELTAPTDPHRAALLRKAVEQSKGDLIDLKFNRLIDLLKQERLSPAVTNQKEVRQDLDKLLELLLSENRDKRLASEQARIKEYLKEIKKRILDEQAIKDQTERGADTQGLAGRQGKNAEKTGDLAKKIKSAEEGDAAKGEGGAKNEDSEDEDQEGAKEEGEKGEGEKGEGEKSEGQKGEGEKGEGQKGEGQKGEGQKGEGEKGEGQKGEGEKSEGEKGEGEKSEGEKPEGEKSEGEKSEGQKGEGQKGEGQKGKGQKSQGQGQGQGQQGQDQQDQQDQQQGDNQQQKGPADVRKRIEAAEQRMKEAQEKLEKARRDEAKEKEDEALKELEKAKADLEEILRLIREEQIERMLAMLEARFRKMLEMQVEVYEGTLRLDRVAESKRGRNDEIEAGRLSRKESAIATEADKALTLLREEGTARAMPEAVEQMLEDMRAVVLRLAALKTDDITQGREEDIIAALEEMIEALQKAQKQMENRKGQPPPTGQPMDQPLIDKLAELRMIRSLQMRVNKRTQRYSKLIDGEQAGDADLLKALDELGEREQKIFKATKDIAVGKNQ